MTFRSSVDPSSSRRQSLKATLDEVPLSKIVLIGLVGLALASVIGELSLWGSVKSIDEAIFHSAVPAIQSVPGLVDVSVHVTKMGSIPVNYGMAIGIGFYGGLQRRSWYLPIAVVGSLFAGHVFQILVDRIVEGTVPADYVLGGSAGPFFSGGVMRVTLMVGMAATLALPPSKDRVVWSLAVAFGIVEGFTRLALGRHWPLDIVAGFPVGLGLLWLFRQAVASWRDGWRTRASDER